jgi:predicted amidohydrolase YtcJ
VEELIVGDVVTMNDAQPRAEALATRGGRVVAVGGLEQVRSAVGPNVTPRHVRGVILPGLVDSHSHLHFASLNLGRLDIRDVRSVPEMLTRVRAYAAAHPTPLWIDGRFDVDAAELAEGRLPTADQLDEASGGRPLRLNRGGHQVLVSRAGLCALDVDGLEAEFGPESVERDADGRPTGVLYGRGTFHATEQAIPPLDRRTQVERLTQMQARYHAFGITGVTEPGLTATTSPSTRTVPTPAR